jgi:hypothetical protein
VLTFPAHRPPACPGTQIQRRKLETTFVVGSGLGDGFLKGCRRKEKNPFFSDGAVLPCVPALGSRMLRTAFE